MTLVNGMAVAEFVSWLFIFSTELCLVVVRYFSPARAQNTDTCDRKQCSRKYQNVLAPLQYLEIFVS